MMAVEFESRPITREDSIATGTLVSIYLAKPDVTTLPRLPDSFGPAVLGALGTASLHVVEPIAVRYFRDGDHVVAEAPELEEFGYGPDIAEARRDLQRTIVELRAHLTANRERLGADLVRLLGVLERKLRPRR